MTFLRNIFHPDRFHGKSKDAPFFEGWYFKLANEIEDKFFAFIPGVFMGDNGYAFIQILNGNTGESKFVKYPLSDFKAAKDSFEVWIGNSYFSLDEIRLGIKNEEVEVEGKLNFSGVNGWPVSVISPGIMGWFAWVPFMECYHGVLGFDHELIGTLSVNGSEINFLGGRGYIEKDWGRSFPEAYIWMQTNHFEEGDVSLTASLALIPWIGYSFPGFIIGLWVKGKLYRFATYTGAKIEKLSIEGDIVEIRIRGRKFTIELRAERAGGGELKGPTEKAMDVRVFESMPSVIDVKLSTSRGEIIFEQTGKHAGLEIVGDLELLRPKK
ncbi:MAG: hypothetical protein HN672_12715 [Chloroflexi bacterium]|nr:hypothetical protein [Chloroflexota bacterium]